MKTGDESEEDEMTFRFCPHGKRNRDEIDAEIRSDLQMAARDRVERGEASHQSGEAARDENRSGDCTAAGIRQRNENPFR